MNTTDDIRIKKIEELAPPMDIMRDIPLSERAAQTTFDSRAAIHRVIHDADDRLVVVIGPCSIHDTQAAIEYAQRLMVEREKYKDTLEIVMRVYFEKPRTTVGWKGLINDPDLNQTFEIGRAHV